MRPLTYVHVSRPIFTIIIFRTPRSVNVMSVSCEYLFCHEVIKVDTRKEDMALHIQIVFSTTTKPSAQGTSTHSTFLTISINTHMLVCHAIDLRDSHFNQDTTHEPSYMYIHR